MQRDDVCSVKLNIRHHDEARSVAMLVSLPFRALAITMHKAKSAYVNKDRLDPVYEALDLGLSGLLRCNRVSILTTVSE